MRTDRAMAGARALALALVWFAQSAAHGADAPRLRMTLAGAPQTLFDTRTDRCAPEDMPDINARAIRTRTGVALFALHYTARAMRGPDLDHLKLDCAPALQSHESDDPALYDGRRYIASLWTRDGVNVAALVHNEYHAEIHAGRCATSDAMSCWWNAIVAFRSHDGARHFEPTGDIVAATPFRQNFDQTRHRGFFNPSNMIAKGAYVYAFASTTGWTGQNYGACLFRNKDPLNSAGWRGWDGREFTARWDDPYRTDAPRQSTCAPIEPFALPVGALVRHRASGLFVAVWEAGVWAGRYERSGFYYATSPDLIDWSAPALLQAGGVSHQPCGEKNRYRDDVTIAYPSIIDPDAEGENFDNIGNEAWLYYARIRNEGCNAAGERTLVREKIRLSPAR
ncbi:MAG: hypothetical protein KGL46_10330 [Hyphomicrobiales bacterium]|nr:hypothetical protein [Hyphomicrobiales bacterium]